MFKNKIFSILFCFLFGFEVAAQTKLQQIGPPYPEVWGYDFSNLPSVNSEGTSISAFEMDDGDIWFFIVKSYKQKRSAPFVLEDIDKQRMLLKFFKNEKSLITEKQYNDICEKFREQGERDCSSFLDKKLVFSDGSTLEKNYDYFGLKRFCPGFYNSYLIKTDKDNKQEKYSILYVSPKTTVWRDGNLDEDTPSGPFFYEKLDTFLSFVPLKDDTFLVFSEGSGLILRFDKNLNTQFKPVNSVKIKDNIIPRNFFVVPYSLIEQLKSSESNKLLFEFQRIQDALLGHFCNLYRN